VKDLLLEIGCENLPPHGIHGAFESLRERAVAALDELRLSYEDIYVTGAPRRLVLIVSGLAERQTAGSETVTGPPLSRAFDESGAPTPAAQGFARARGVDVASLETVTTDKGEFVGVVQKLPVERTSRLLKEAIPAWIGQLRFPKVMRWEQNDVLFARPIRWLVCVLGETVVPFSIAGVKSSNLTYGVPWIRHRGLKVRSAGHYRSVMKRLGVIVDHSERRRRIEAMARRAAERNGLRLIDEPDLLDELTYMLEDPRPLMGEFDAKYLSLPPEVVTTAMKSHQRYLAFKGPRGKLVPRFLTFTEGRAGSPAQVRRGNEKVLRARLEDALFYWHEDLSAGMDGLAERLDSIVFIEGLGSLGDKSRRLAGLSKAVSSALDGDAPAPAVVERAAHLAKADLASEMIKDGKEFTLLQGLIGSRYAAASGEPGAVVDALREQYLPRAPKDPLPRGEAGRILSVADRLDTIAGCFLAGFQPTGSQDPYALRRQANGLLRLVENAQGFSLAPLLEQAVASYGGYQTPVPVDEALGSLTEFFKTRVGAYLKEKGIVYDVVDAVAAVAWDAPGTALARARAAQALRGDATFELLITGVKRVGNILAAERKRYGLDWSRLERAFADGQLPGGRSFNAASFEDDAERDLHAAVGAAIPRVRAADEAGDIDAVLRRLAELGPPIDRYFDRVLVNCEDPALRENRHDFLAAVFALFSKYADFSLIVEDGPSVPR